MAVFKADYGLWRLTSKTAREAIVPLCSIFGNYCCPILKDLGFASIFDFTGTRVTGIDDLLVGAAASIYDGKGIASILAALWALSVSACLRR